MYLQSRGNFVDGFFEARGHCPSLQVANVRNGNAGNPAQFPLCQMFAMSYLPKKFRFNLKPIRINGAYFKNAPSGNSRPDSGSYRGNPNARGFCPLYRGFCCSPNSDPDLSPIARLLAGCGPTAVARFVIAVVFDSFQRVFDAWTLSHVCIKVFKRIPPLANTNASAPVIVKCSSISVVAPHPHPLPNFIFWKRTHAMTQKPLVLSFFQKASTASRVPASERHAGNDNFIAADAPALPCRFSVFAASSTGNNFKSAIDVASQIYDRAHNCIVLRLSLRNKSFNCLRGAA